MTETHFQDLGLTEKNSSGCACGHDGGCACGGAHDHGAAHDHGHHAADTAPASSGGAVVADFGVSGMTCEHCVRSVTEELSELEGVSAVNIDLQPGGVSTVRVSSAAPLEESAVRDAVDEAGYELVPRP